MEKNEYKYDCIICSCGSTEHDIIITRNENKDYDDNVYLSIHLVNERNIFKRIKYAIKYIFGYKSKYGCFDEIILDKRHYEKIKEIADYLK